jgi:hypothetical protein
MRDDGCEGGALWVGLGTPSGRTEDFGNADNQSRRGFCCRFIVFLLGTGIAQNRGLGPLRGASGGGGGAGPRCCAVTAMTSGAGPHWLRNYSAI